MPFTNRDCFLTNSGDLEVRDSLLEFPTRGDALDGKIVRTEPLMDRFYETLCG